MSQEAILITGITLAVVAGLSLVALRRPAAVSFPPTPIVRLFPSAGRNPSKSNPGPVWHMTVLNSLAGAEELLDWLESHGHRDRRLVGVANDRFVVRWR